MNTGRWRVRLIAWPRVGRGAKYVYTGEVVDTRILARMAEVVGMRCEQQEQPQFTAEGGLAQIRAYCAARTGQACRMRLTAAGYTCECGWHGMEMYAGAGKEAEGEQA